MAAPIYRGGAPFWGTYHRFSNSVATQLQTASTPVDGTSGTGVGVAGPGSTCVALDTGAWYFNSGTKASPVWTAFGSTAGAATPSSVVSSGAITSTSDTGGVGYATGAGGAVEQGTSRTTGVTLDTVCGAITLVSAAGSTTPASFTVTNAAVAETDVVILSQVSGTDIYDLSVSAVAAGSFRITFNTKSGTTTEQPVINFAVIKGVAA
jgi:hypothetical protein